MRKKQTPRRSASSEAADVVNPDLNVLMTNRRSVLLEAADLVDGDRNNQYGDPIGDFRCTADMWAAYLRRRPGIPADFALQPHDVAAMMSLLKVSRIGWSPEKRDHWSDLAGYAACGYDCSVRENDS